LHTIFGTCLVGVAGAAGRREKTGGKETFWGCDA